MRVAVAQFATSSNTQQNLATCIRMIKEAVKCKPAIIILPEYCNTQANQQNHQQAWDEALSLNGEFLQQIAALAKLHHCNIVLNVTLRRDLVRNEENALIKSNISITTCTFSETGELIHQADKQTLQAHENQFFISTKNSRWFIYFFIRQIRCFKPTLKLRVIKTPETKLSKVLNYCVTYKAQMAKYKVLYIPQHAHMTITYLLPRLARLVIADLLSQIKLKSMMTAAK